jgi:DNA-binding MarR family transcriptional regulator
MNSKPNPATLMLMDRAYDHRSEAEAVDGLQLPRLLERMHRRYLDIVQVELKRIGVRDINPVQAFMLLDMGNEDLTTQELVDRGYYIRNNALYNIRKLTEAGYYEQSRDPNDRRAMRIALTPKARTTCEKLRARLARIDAMIAAKGALPHDPQSVYDTLRSFERSWDDYLRFGTV